ncbi:MAG: hypothetical protein ABID79_04385 [Elusimicrobiota bacterium]
MTNNISDSDTPAVDKTIRLNQWFQNISITAIFNFFFYAIILMAPLVVYGVSIAGISVRPSRILIILIIPVLLLRIMKKPILIVRDNFFIFGILPYLVYTTISVIWSPNVETGASISRLGGLYEIIIIYIVFMAADLNAARFEKFVKYYVLSALIPLGCSMWQLLNNVLHFSQTELPFRNFLIEGKYTEVFEGRYFVAAGEFSRLSATFAEPVIFGGFICSVLLLSFLLDYKNYFSLIIIRLFQIVAFVAMVLTISKLALVTFTIGILFISRKNKKYLLLFFAGLFIIMGVMAYYNMLNVFDRIFSATGHYARLMESFEQIKDQNLITGEGIGSVPYGSFHRFVLSRFYESGIIGLIFVFFVSIIPFKLLYRKITDVRLLKINNICVGVMFAILSGLHLYDYFIHLFTWIVIGAIMSFYNSSREIAIA